jgi:DNA-binding NtrC family response regulator
VETAIIDSLDLRSDQSSINRSGSSNEREMLHIRVGTSLADAERSMIFATLRHCAGNKTRAAALLGVSLKTLYNRLNAYRAQGIEDRGISGNELMEGAF